MPARTVRLLASATALAALAVPSSASAACVGADDRPTAENALVAERATLCLVNQARGRNGLRRLKANPALGSAADSFARQMVRERFFDHVSPSGLDPTARLRRVGYVTSTVSWSIGENLGWASGGSATPRSMVRMWLESPGHRANILNGRYRELGVGLALGTPRGDSTGATYVHEFGYRS